MHRCPHAPDLALDRPRRYGTALLRTPVAAGGRTGPAFDAPPGHCTEGIAMPTAKGPANPVKVSMSRQRAAEGAESPAALIDAKIRDLRDWRGDVLVRIRALVKEAVPGVTEEWKWNTPVWSHHGIICTGETYKTVVKMTFPKGASVADPSRLFNSSLEGKVRRAIDFHEGAQIDEGALKDLLRAAVAANKPSASAKSARVP